MLLFLVFILLEEVFYFFQITFTIRVQIHYIIKFAITANH